MAVKRDANHYGPTTAAIVILMLGFFLSTAFSAENRIQASQAVDSSGTQTDQSASESAAGSASEASAGAFFPAGSWSIYGYGGAALGKTSHRIYAGNPGVGYHFIDDFSLNLEAAGYFVDHARDTGGSGVDILFRWHPIHGRSWSLYLDGGPGFIYTRKTLRDPGTHFNFTVQGGAGFTCALTDSLLSVTGLRWFHISNARIRGKNRNVGFDSPMLYLGLMYPFR